jgi:hypothetical protein
MNSASPAEGNFYSHSGAGDVLERLPGLPDARGVRAIRSEFESRPERSG